MVASDVARDGKAQSGPGAFPVGVDAVEALEDPGEMLSRDPDALVFHGAGDIPACAFGLLRTDVQHIYLDNLFYAYSTH